MLKRHKDRIALGDDRLRRRYLSQKLCRQYFTIFDLSLECERIGQSPNDPSRVVITGEKLSCMDFFHSKYTVNTSFLVAERVLRLFIGLLVSAYLARYLEPESFGIYSYAISFVALFGAVATLGLDGVVIRELVKCPGSETQLLGSAALFRLVGGLLAIALVVGALFALNVEANVRWAALIISVGLIFQAASVVDLYFQARVKAKYGSAVRLIQIGLSAFLKFLAIYAGAELLVFVWLLLFDAILLAGLYLLSYPRYAGVSFRFHYDREIFVRLLSAAGYLLITDILISMNTRVDQIMLKTLSGYESVGYYAAASTLSEAWYFIPMAVSASIFPLLVKSHEQSRANYLRHLQELTNIMVWVSLALALLVMLIAEPAIELIYGADYDQSASILVIHIWTGLFVFMGVATGKGLLADKAYDVIRARALVAFVSNLGFNLVFIPRYGASGAALSLLVSQCLACLFTDALYPHSRYLFYIKLRALFFIDRKMPVWLRPKS